MSADALRNAIQKPLQVTHPQNRFAPELLERLVQDGGADAALLPLLQVTLAELWKTGKLLLSNYHSLTNAIRQRADTVYDFSDYDKADPKIKRSTDEQQALMAILLDLINVSVDGADRRDARQRRTRQELEQGSAQRPRLIEELVNARLLSAASETRNGVDVEVIEIIHESLIDNWDRLRNAIEEQHQQLQRRARFKLWLGEWLRNGRQDGYLLLTDMQLAEAQALVDARDIEVQDKEAREFYKCSLDQQESKQQQELYRVKELANAQQRRAQTFRCATAIAIILMAVAVHFAVQANKQQNVAYRERNEALRQSNLAISRYLIAQAIIERTQKRSELGWLLRIEAISKIRNETSEIMSTLLSLLTSDSTFTGVAQYPNDHRKSTQELIPGVVVLPQSPEQFIADACLQVKRNFTWLEWNIYMQENQVAYRPTCSKAPIPPDAIEGIQEEARQQILAGQVVNAIQRLDELNRWLQSNGQFKNDGVDVQTFVSEVQATATTEAKIIATPNH